MAHCVCQEPAEVAHSGVSWLFVGVARWVVAARWVVSSDEAEVAARLVVNLVVSLVVNSKEVVGRSDVRSSAAAAAARLGVMAACSLL